MTSPHGPEPAGMTEKEARAEAARLNDVGLGPAIATHAGRARQDQLPPKEWVVITGPLDFE